MKPHVGTDFDTETPAGRINLKLTDARKVMGSEAARLPRHPFSLFFAGPKQPYLPQRIYRLHHPAFSEPLEIFLVPVEGGREGYTYEAVFT